MIWFFVCVVFVCLEFIVPLETFSLIMRRHHCRWRAANFDLLCSALIAIEQWGFFSVPHLLWHGASVYNCHLRGSVTHTPITERLAAVSTCFYDLGLSLLGFEHPTFRLWGKRSISIFRNKIYDWTFRIQSIYYSQNKYKRGITAFILYVIF